MRVMRGGRIARVGRRYARGGPRGAGGEAVREVEGSRARMTGGGIKQVGWRRRTEEGAGRGRLEMMDARPGIDGAREAWG